MKQIIAYILIGIFIPTQVLAYTETRYIGDLYEEDSNGRKVSNVKLGGKTIVRKINGEMYWIHTDHLGNTNLMTDINGNVVKQTSRTPYGDKWLDLGGDLGDRNFTGQIEDNESGLTHLKTRYYDNSLGRFITPDPIHPPAGGSEALNRYSYAFNNPINVIDPDGQFGIFAAVAAVFKGIVAAFQAHPIITSAMVASATNVAQNANNIHNFGDYYKHATIGAAIGGAMGGVSAFLSNQTLNLAQWAVGGGVVAGTGSAINGGNFGEGFTTGAIGGAALWGGGLVMAQDFFGAGVLGNVISSGGASAVESGLRGKDIETQYLIHFGPLAVNLEKGMKPQFGISSLNNVFHLADQVIGPAGLDWKLTISSGTPVFSFVKPYGQARGNNILLGEYGQTVTSTPKKMALTTGVDKQFVLGHERVHALLQSRLGAGLGRVNSYYAAGGDVNNLLHLGVYNFGDYMNDPAEFNAYSFPSYGN